MSILAESIKLFSITVLIVVLLRFRVDLGLTMFIASLTLSLLFQIGLKTLFYNIYLTIIDPITLLLIGTVVFVYMLSGILKRTRSMKDIVGSLECMVSDYRLILFFIASFLGLIPMTSGAMFSAPLAKEIGESNEMSPEEIMLSNYWFRHVWEFIWPLVPGVVLYTSMIGISSRELMVIHLPFSIFALLLGFFWMYLNIKKRNNSKTEHNNFRLQLWTFLKSAWSILLIILLVMFFKVHLLIALLISIVLLIVVHRVSGTMCLGIIRHDIPVKVVAMIVGIMLFKQILDTTNSLEPISRFLSEIGINIWVILFLIPLLMGSLTGMTAGFVGVSFPIILPLMMKDGSLNMSMAMFAYLAGFSGMMLSPMHLCFSLTVEYLQVDLTKLYKKLLPNVLILIIISFVYIFIFT